MAALSAEVPSVAVLSAEVPSVAAVFPEPVSAAALSPVPASAAALLLPAFLPVLLLALKNPTVVLTKDKNRSILYLMCCLNGYALVRLFSIVCIRL